WKWSSYRATAGLGPKPQFLTTDWILGQFGRTRSIARKKYREFVREGRESRPWDELRGQIFLGSERFIEKHRAGDQEIKEIPRVMRRPRRPRLAQLFARNQNTALLQDR